MSQTDTPTVAPATAPAVQKIEPPTPIAQEWVRYVLGFGVGVAIGLSVYLGKLGVPLFSPLLDLIPEPLQQSLIPLSSALMGIVAVVVQFFSYRHWANQHVRPLFVRTTIYLVIALLALMVVHTFVVVTIDTVPGRSASFLVGFTRPEQPPCSADISDAECIKRLTFDTSAIASFWGDRRLRVAKLALQLTYLATTSIFGALVGLVVLTVRRQKPPFSG